MSADRTLLDDTVFVREGVTFTQVNIKNFRRILRPEVKHSSTHRWFNSSTHEAVEHSITNTSFAAVLSCASFGAEGSSETTSAAVVVAPMLVLMSKLC